MQEFADQFDKKQNQKSGVKTPNPMRESADPTLNAGLNGIFVRRRPFKPECTQRSKHNRIYVPGTCSA